MIPKVVYCFDKDLADKLSTTTKLLKQDTVDNKPCWIFIEDNNNKLKFDELDKTKVVISNRLNF